MGERGPAGKPTALKVLEGNPGKRALNPAEPQPAPLIVIPKPPIYLPTEAKKEWKRIVPQLMSLGLLTDLDVSGLAAYCNAFSTWVDAVRQLKGAAMIVPGARGGLISNPLLKVASDAQSEMKKWLCEFGMTPSARSRVAAVPAADEVDPLDALINRKAQA